MNFKHHKTETLLFYREQVRCFLARHVKQKDVRESCFHILKLVDKELKHRHIKER